MSSVVKTAVAVGQHFARRGVVAATNRRARLNRILVAIERDRGETLVHIDYLISIVSGPDDRDIYLDGVACPFPLVRCEPGEGLAARIPRVLYPGRTAGVVRLRIAPDFEVGEFRPRLTLKWPQSREFPRVLVAPDMIPTLLRSASAGPEPQPVVSLSTELPGSYQLGGVHAPGELGTFHQVFLADSVIECLRNQNTSIHVTDGLARSISYQDRELMATEIADTLNVFREMFGAYGSQDVLVAIASDFGRLSRVAREFANGACLLTRPEHAHAPRHALAATVRGQSLAGMWWPGGCKMYGDNAMEYQYAVTGGAALLRCYHVADKRDFESLRYSLEASLARAKRTDWLSAIQGHMKRGRATSLMLNVFDALRGDASVLTELEHLTRENWGRWVPSEVIASRLLRSGVGGSAR